MRVITSKRRFMSDSLPSGTRSVPDGDHKRHGIPTLIGPGARAHQRSRWRNWSRLLPGDLGLGVARCAGQVDGDVGFVADDPAVMAGGDIEDVARCEVVFPAVAHLDPVSTGNDHAHMLDFAILRACRGTDMGGPLPSRLVDGLPEGHPSDPEQIEVALLERAM